MSPKSHAPMEASAVPVPMPASNDLGLLQNVPMLPSVEDKTLAAFVNDIRGIVPNRLQTSSWMYTSNLMGLASYSPRIAEGIRHRYNEYSQYLKMSIPRSAMTPELSLWINNLRLLGSVQTSRAEKPNNERRALSVSTSEMITQPLKPAKKGLLPF